MCYSSLQGSSYVNFGTTWASVYVRLLLFDSQALQLALYNKTKCQIIVNMLQKISNSAIKFVWRRYINLLFSCTINKHLLEQTVALQQYYKGVILEHTYCSYCRISTIWLGCDNLCASGTIWASWCSALLPFKVSDNRGDSNSHVRPILRHCGFSALVAIDFQGKNLM